MHDKKMLLIASHYLNDRTQKLDARNYPYFAYSVLFSKLTLILRVLFFGQVEIFLGKLTFDNICPTGKWSKKLISIPDIILIHYSLSFSSIQHIVYLK